ncbi:MAG: caspase family protein [Spirochaetota bacterium]
MKRSLIAITAAILLSLTISCSLFTYPPAGEFHAVLYGLDYQDISNKSPLIQTVNDASDFKQYLDYFDYHNIELFNGTDDPTSPYSSDDIFGSLPDNTLKKSDTFLFYLAGHGSQDGKIVTESESNEVISPEELFSELDGTGAGTIVVILDICYSGAFVLDDGYDTDGLPDSYGDDSPEAYQESWSKYFDPASSERSYPNIHVISAAGSAEESLEDYELENGAFTYYLLDALGYDHAENTVPGYSYPADRNSDGYITLSEAYKEAFDRFQSEFLSGIPSDSRYYPHITGGPGDPILVVL